jgi:hypothetical protein
MAGRGMALTYHLWRRAVEERVGDFGLPLMWRVKTVEELQKEVLDRREALERMMKNIQEKDRREGKKIRPISIVLPQDGSEGL